MSDAGGSCLPSRLPRVGLQHHQDDSVRDQKEEEPDEDQHPTVGDHKELQEGGVCAGKSQYLWNVTVEVIQDVGATKRQWEHQSQLDNGVDKAPYPGSNHQPHTHSSVHDGDIVEGPGDGYVAVIGHH